MTLRHWLRILPGRFRTVGRIFRHFDSPWLVVAMRLGLIRPPWFGYGIRRDGHRWRVLARPSAAFHSDLAVLDEVLVRESYAPVLAHLPAGPLRGLDVGANIGAFALWIGSHRPLAELHCFEPAEDSFRLLRFNLDGTLPVRTHAHALGGTDRRARLHMRDGQPGGVGLFGDAAEGDPEVEVLALRSWMSTVEGHFDFLKLDCEGAEWEILTQTPRETLRRFAVIFGELHSPPGGQTPFTAFPALLESAGFRVITCGCHHLGFFLAVRA